MSDYSTMMEKALLYDAGASGQLLVDAMITDGSATIAWPSYQHLTFASVNSGSSATIDGNGDLVLNAKGQPLTIEWRISATQNKGRQVFFGYSWDGGRITRSQQEIVGNGATPVFILFRIDLVGAETGNTLALHISSGWDQQATQWTDGEIMVVGPQS